METQKPLHGQHTRPKNHTTNPTKKKWNFYLKQKCSEEEDEERKRKGFCELKI